MARISLIEENDHPELAELIGKIRAGRRGALINIYKLLLHAPPLSAIWLDFVGTARFNTELAGRLEGGAQAVRRVGEGGSALDPAVVSQLVGRRRHQLKVRRQRQPHASGIGQRFPEHDRPVGDEILPVREALKRLGLSDHYVLLAGGPHRLERTAP